MVIIGKNTHNAPDVEEDVKIAKRLNKSIFQIGPRAVTAGQLDAVNDVIRWQWRRIDAAIDEITGRR